MSIDNVADLSPRVQYTAGASQVDFDFPFAIFADGDLVVDVDGVTKTLTTDYTVSGAGDDAGGTVTFFTGQTAGAIVTIYRDTAIERTTDFQQNGPWSSVSFNDELDRMTIWMQELEDRIGRAIRFPRTSISTNAQAEMGPISTFFGKLLRISATGILEAAAVTDSVVTLTASVIGALLDPRTQAEIDAGVTPVNYAKKPGDPLRYELNADPGVTDMTEGIQAALNSGHPVVFRDEESYRITTGITRAADNVSVDFGNATIVCDFSASGTAFFFGTVADTPQHDGLRVRGGSFTLETPGSTLNVPYIRVAGVQDFEVTGIRMRYVSNGGIKIEVGCDNGDVHANIIRDKSGYSTVRGIWVTGDSASDWAAQLVDTESYTRNGTAVPAFGAKNIRVHDNTVDLAAYGIYLMNAHDCQVVNNDVDTKNSGLRCVAINNYSPNAKVSGNTLRASDAATGVLVTQFSTGVQVTDNTFLGTFGGGQDVLVQFLAKAALKGNTFLTDSTKNVLVDSGASAVIRENDFERVSGFLAGTRCVDVGTLHSGASGTDGDTAETLAGVIFSDNQIINRPRGVRAFATASGGGRVAGLSPIIVKGNDFYNYDETLSGGDYPVTIDAPGSTYTIDVSFFDNSLFPVDNALRNKVQIVSGTGYNVYRDDVQFSQFQVAIASGAVTSTKTFGGHFSCTGSLASNDLLLAPRTVGGASGAKVARIVGVADAGGTTPVYSFEMFLNGTNYQIKLYDSGGSLITLTSADATVDVFLIGTAT